MGATCEKIQTSAAQRQIRLTRFGGFFIGCRAAPDGMVLWRCYKTYPVPRLVKLSDRNLIVEPPPRSRFTNHPAQGCAPTPANTSRSQIEICQRSLFLNSSTAESWGPLWGSDSVIDDTPERYFLWWMVSRSEAIHLKTVFVLFVFGKECAKKRQMAGKFRARSLYLYLRDNSGIEKWPQALRQ